MDGLMEAAVLGATCGLMIGVVLLIGGRVWHRATVEAQATQAAVAGVVRARKFEVVDAAGKERAFLGMEYDGMAALGLCDAAGRLRASLSTISDGTSSLALLDATNKARVGLSLYPDGRAYLALLNAAEGVRRALVELGVGSDGRPELGLRDEAGNVIWSAP